MLNPSDPTNPWPVALLSSFGEARSACVHNGLLLVANHEKGPTILRAPFGASVP